MGNAASGDAGSIDGSSSTGSLGKESSFASGKESSSAPPSRSSTFKGAFDAEAEVEDAALLPSRAPSGASPYFLNLLRCVRLAWWLGVPSALIDPCLLCIPACCASR